MLARGTENEFASTPADNDAHAQIARLEAKIEELAESAERCRKIMLFSKAAIAIGSATMLLIVLVPIRLDPTALIAAIAAVIGGIVGLGSNMRTLQQIRDAMQSAEMLRSRLIDGFAPQTIEGPSA